jgi:hypothetical protein
METISDNPNLKITITQQGILLMTSNEWKYQKDDEPLEHASALLAQMKKNINIATKKARNYDSAC